MNRNSIPCAFLFLLLIAGLNVTAMPMNTTQVSPFSGDTVNISEVMQAAPLNPEFIPYQVNGSQAIASADREQGFDDISSPVYTPEMVNVQMEDLSGQEFASTFDLREIGKVSPVRDQKKWGTGWAISALGSLESNLMPEMNRTFSPKNMVNLHGFDYGYNDGGGIYPATAYLTRWNGPVDEETDPYPDINWTDSQEYPPVVHVQDVIIYPVRTNRTDTSSIKAGLQRWGAAVGGIYWDESFYNNSSTGYYMPESSSNPKSGGTRAMNLVGWNDTFPASAFSQTPPGDGAWIVRNNRGSAWGDKGFFYVSYYDKYIGSVIDKDGNYRNTAFFTAEPVDNYDQIYLHDPLGDCVDYYINEPKNSTVATRYNATQSGTINAIGFYTTDVQTRYNAVIYQNADNGPLGDVAARLEGNLTTMGYHTVPLPEGSEVSLTKGENFSVVLTLENANYDYPVAIEEPYPGYSSRATAQPGESYAFINETGSFFDLTVFNPNMSACVRAYTRTVPEPVPTPSILSASFTAKPVIGKAPLSVQFTDTSTGNPSRWLWNLGTGEQSVLQNPEMTYTEPGTYSVSLIIGKDRDVDQISKYRYITVRNATNTTEG